MIPVTRPCNYIVTGIFIVFRLFSGGNMTFQQIILALQRFWSKQGCILGEPYDVEKGAGTMNPATFLRTMDRNHGT